MATPCDPTQVVFDTTIRDFRARLKNEALYREILQTTTIDQVYDATDKLQEEQAQKGQLRHLSKIEPYLEGLRSYASVIEVFMQAKPEILALIWGPIKLLLQWASNLKHSLDAIINVTAEIGVLLPEFRKAAHLFSHNAPVKEVLALFFRDILDFYVIALRFFSLPRWKYLFESVWPKHRDKIKIVTNHIERHTLLLRNEVRLEHIQAEHDARTRALEHFEKIEESSQRQEFHSIRTDISPPTYEEKLDYVDGRMCQGTGKWLLKDTTFTTWLKNTDTSTRVLWLQGIPGSGKTFLSSTAIHETRKVGHSVFAFLSYAFSNHASALNIMQSLIFQLASDDDDLKAIVCRSSRSNLKSSISATKDLLLALIRAAGAVYITIDGLDEIDGVERSRLLKNLLQLMDECNGAKMLISSRPEADITGLLKEKSTVLRVDNRNSGSIQRFITEYMRNWFRERDFLPKAQSEIERLLAPLASKSKGMFLYAKVVLGSIEHLDVEEIQDDIQVLPDTLDNAYARVLARINGLAPPTLKEKARKLLGWIGAAPTPLTVQEIEQALTIKLEDVEGKARVLSKLNIIQICGPIVEVVDDYVQFVHFTVQEYFFSPQVLGSIDAGENKLSLAMCCVMYLCQGHHDPEISSEDSLDNTLTGAYSLHDFASTMWLELTEQLASESCNILSELVSLLETLICERANDQHDGTNEQVTSPTLDTLKRRWPHVYTVLCDAVSFRKLSFKSDFRKSHITSWSHLDPLTISNTSARIHDHHETLLSDTANNKNDYLTSIHRHYGKRPFKCDYVNCYFRRHGFESASLRKTHMGYHSRSWKCTFPGCEYEDGGFLTRKMQAEHLNEFHQDRAEASSGVEKPDADEMQPLLFDLVKANKVEIVKGLLEEVQKLPKPTRRRLAECAARFGTPSMVELFPITESLLKSAVEGKNPDTFRSILSKLGAQDTWRYDWGHRLASEIISCDSEEIWVEWSKLIDRSAAKQAPNAHQASWLATASLDATAGDPYREQLLKSVWEKHILKILSKAQIGDVLVAVASSTCSVMLAKVLIDHGAAVDYRRSDKYLTPLHHAARKPTQEAAELMKFLLLCGADPEATSARSSIQEEKGAMGISKWLGISWDELVMQAKEDRAKEKRAQEARAIEEGGKEEVVYLAVSQGGTRWAIRQRRRRSP